MGQRAGRSTACAWLRALRLSQSEGHILVARLFVPFRLRRSRAALAHCACQCALPRAAQLRRFLRRRHRHTILPLMHRADSIPRARARPPLRTHLRQLLLQWVHCVRGRLGSRWPIRLLPLATCRCVGSRAHRRAPGRYPSANCNRRCWRPCVGRSGLSAKASCMCCRHCDGVAAARRFGRTRRHRPREELGLLAHCEVIPLVLPIGFLFSSAELRATLAHEQIEGRFFGHLATEKGSESTRLTSLSLVRTCCGAPLVGVPVVRPHFPSFFCSISRDQYKCAHTRDLSRSGPRAYNNPPSSHDAACAFYMRPSTMDGGTHTVGSESQWPNPHRAHISRCTVRALMAHPACVPPVVRVCAVAEIPLSPV